MMRFAKTLFQILIAVVALCCGLVACDDSNDDSYVNQKLKVVAIPDFVFKSSDIVLSTTTNTLATRAGDDYYTRDNAAWMEETDDVSVKLYVTEDSDKFLLVDNVEDTDFRAVLISVDLRTSTDVEVFMPIGSQHFSYNSQVALEMRSMVYTNSIQATNKISKLKSIYGEAAMTCIVNSDTVVAKIGYGRIENGTEGVELTVTGVSDRVINNLRHSFDGGLRIEAWNYFKSSISRDALRNIIHSKTTVDFSK